MGAGIGLGVNSPCFCLGKTIQIRSAPANVLACLRPKFSLKCSAASSSLYFVIHIELSTE